MIEKKETVCGHKQSDWKDYGEYSVCSICGLLDVNYIKTYSDSEEEKEETKMNNDYEFDNNQGLSLNVEKVESNHLNTIYGFKFAFKDDEILTFKSVEIKFYLLEFELDAIIKGLTLLRNQPKKR